MIKSLKSPDPFCKELAMLYVSTRNLSNETPEGMLKLYMDAYNKIQAEQEKLIEADKEINPPKKQKINY